MGTFPMLVPVLVLVLWSCVQLVWAILARIKAVNDQGLSASDGQRTSTLANALPPQAQFKADNYNHLMEQPTIFYATVLALTLAGLDGAMNVSLAWAYTGLRIVHSVVQSTTNTVMVRLPLFVLSTLCLVALAISGLVALT